MPVTSKNLDAAGNVIEDRGQPKQPRMQFPDPSLWLAYIGVGLVAIAFGGVVWAINGGYSIAGLEVLAGKFNSSGTIFWAAASAWRMQVPVPVPGIATTQPVLPWLGVIGISILQIAVIYRRLKGLRMPFFVWLAAAVCSAYDVTTTYYGLGTSSWLQVSETTRAIIALVLSLTFETVVGFVLRRLLGRQR